MVTTVITHTTIATAVNRLHADNRLYQNAKYRYVLEYAATTRTSPPIVDINISHQQPKVTQWNTSHANTTSMYHTEVDCIVSTMIVTGTEQYIQTVYSSTAICISSRHDTLSFSNTVTFHQSHAITTTMKSPYFIVPHQIKVTSHQHIEYRIVNGNREHSLHYYRRVRTLVVAFLPSPVISHVPVRVPPVSRIRPECHHQQSTAAFLSADDTTAPAVVSSLRHHAHIEWKTSVGLQNSTPAHACHATFDHFATEISSCLHNSAPSQWAFQNAYARHVNNVSAICHISFITYASHAADYRLSVCQPPRLLSDVAHFPFSHQQVFH